MGCGAAPEASSHRLPFLPAMLAAAGPGVSKPGLGSTGGREAQFPAQGGGGLRVGIARRQALGRPGLSGRPWAVLPHPKPRGPAGGLRRPSRDGGTLALPLPPAGSQVRC